MTSVRPLFTLGLLLGFILTGVACGHVDSEGPGTGGTGGTTGGSLGAGGGTPELDREPVESPDPDAQGRGPCSDTTLGEFVSKIYELMPELSDITHIQGDDTFGGEGGLEIYPLESEDGFSIAFKRGSGDCPSGCISEEFHYFDSNQACEPELSGMYSAILRDDEGCFSVEGESMWGLGRVVAADLRCDFDPTPHEMTGSYTTKAKGKTSLCPDNNSVEWEGEFSFVIGEDPGEPADPAAATVEFENIHPWVDGIAWPGRIVAGRFSVEVDAQSETCDEHLAFSFVYDADEQMGTFELFEVATFDCTDPDADYCKGEMSLVLAP